MKTSRWTSRKSNLSDDFTGLQRQLPFPLNVQSLVQLVTRRDVSSRLVERIKSLVREGARMLLLGKLLGFCSDRRSNRGHSTKLLRRAVDAIPLMEALDSRVLLSSTYTVASTGVTDVYLTQNTSLGTGYVDIKLNSPTATPITFLSPDPITGAESLYSTSTGLAFHDFVPAVS